MTRRSRDAPVCGEPAGPASPFGPAGPASPFGPAGPAGPAGPCAPASPFGPCGPCGPGLPSHAAREIASTAAKTTNERITETFQTLFQVTTLSRKRLSLATRPLYGKWRDGEKIEEDSMMQLPTDPAKLSGRAR